MRQFGGYSRQPLYTAATADTDGEELVVQSENGSFVGGAFQVSGTLTSVIVYFECTVDGTNWVALECVPAGDSATPVTQATAAGVWTWARLGLYKVRARLDHTTGSVTVYGTLVS